MSQFHEASKIDIAFSSERDAEDIAALAHFSGYLAKEASRLGLPDAAAMAQVIQCQLLSALQHN